MDSVIDLSARAVSFIILIQDAIVAKELKYGKRSDSVINKILSEKNLIKDLKPPDRDNNYEKFVSRVIELFWVRTSPDEEEAKIFVEELCEKLVSWLQSHSDTIKSFKPGDIPTPYEWREIISNILYALPVLDENLNQEEKISEKLILAKILHYLPIQVVLAMGGGSKSAEEQRVLQQWGVNDAKEQTKSITRDLFFDLFFSTDKEVRESFKNDSLKLTVELFCKNTDDQCKKAQNYRNQTNGTGFLEILIGKMAPMLLTLFKSIEPSVSMPSLEACIEAYKGSVAKNVDSPKFGSCVEATREVRLFLRTILNKKDKTIFAVFYRHTTEALLQSDTMLKAWLLNANVPLPFEFVFGDELCEIDAARQKRKLETAIVHEEKDTFLQTAKNYILGKDESEQKEGHPPSNAAFEPASGNMYSNAAKMNLFALAISGGGIRSATFGLGILQGMARRNLLNRFDYISTASGGGYIGSWLATWIKRDGSVKKINDRLNPTKSSDPMADEVMPIRWLRMFSNYFNPNSSITSADSWTVGVTLIRNMILNLVVIFMLLTTCVLSGYFLYQLWIYVGGLKSHALIYSCGALLFISSLFAGRGMFAYVRSQPLNKYRQTKFVYWALEKAGNISIWIVLSAFIGAYLISAYQFDTEFDIFGFSEESKRDLIFSAIIVLICMMIVAFMGGYNRCITTREGERNLIKSGILILGSGVIAVLVGGACFWGVWELLQNLFLHPTLLSKKIAFVVGIPLVIEIFTITVVTRMALLGKYFPDERREWWGRLGALVHRISIAWLLVAACTMLGKYFVDKNFERIWIALGGWTGIIAATVSAAKSSQTSGNKKTSGAKNIFLSGLSLAGPYIFIIGILVFLPRIVFPLVAFVHGFLKGFTNSDLLPLPLILWTFLGIIVVMAFITYCLARMIGVNEFSMHLFYRNRLVRAYLGATRRRTERDKTANTFTNFDMLDDEPLAKFTVKEGYYGPYPLLNCALNASELTELDRQDRKAESFAFTPLYCGFDFSRVRSSVSSKNKAYDYGYRVTDQYALPGGPGIGTALAISGAAANPNQGYHSSPATAFLLTVFNVQMGWWIGNPRKMTWKKNDPSFGLAYLLKNLVGNTSTRNNFVCLSDGGHFDNMGLYELVRRHTAFIMLCDGEQDENFTCEGLANAIRRCRIDFGVEIEIDVKPITERKEGFSSANFAIGTIQYTDKEIGILLYIKSSITNGKDEAGLPVDVAEYASNNPAFPHQSTGDQFFNEQQFESYRKLGLHIVDSFFNDMSLSFKNSKGANKISKKLHDQIDNFFT